MFDRDASARPPRHPALHDPLTGLANSALFADRAEQAFARCSRSGAALTVILIALDSLGPDGERSNPPEGDAVLVQAARSLESALRAEDTVARLDGEEFVVLVEGVEDLGRAGMLAKRLCETLRRNIETRTDSREVRLSFGVALGIASETDVEELLRDADTALSATRTTDGDSVQVFTSAMHEPAHERLRLQVDLRRALERSELVLFYRPTLEQPRGELRGFAAVPCWSHPSLGLVTADRLIPLAEETGLIVPIGRWILREALRQLSAWDALHAGARNLTLTVDISAIHLGAPGLLSDVRGLLANSNIEPGRVLLRTTETPLADDADPLLAVFTELKSLGLRVAVENADTTSAPDPSSLSKAIPAEVAEGLLSGDIAPASNQSARDRQGHVDPQSL
jgi:diguanylate cyclase (GGDEF)-like protein